MYLAVMEENARKSGVFAAAVAVVRLKAEAGFTWSFDANRVLRVSIPGLTVPERNAIQAACDTRFGPGKVVVS